MKKIVGILGMAAVLASGAFAAEPKANFVMADFTGSAEFGWKADFKDSDNVTSGMYNTTAASIKFGIVDEGDKTTTGDGIWGELKIKAGATAITNSAIKLGNVKPVADGGTAWGESGNDWTKNADGTYTVTDVKGMKQNVSIDGDGNVWLNLPNFLPTASVDTAKIHFVDGDFSVALNILKPGLAYDGMTPFSAVPVAALDGINANKEENLKAGFGLEFAMKDMFAFNFKLMDNGTGHTAGYKQFGMAMDASLKAIKNLDARVASAFNFESEYVGFLADAAYKFPLEALSDKTYVKAGVAYSYNNAKTLTDKKGDDKNQLGVGVLFGWGAEGQKPELDCLTPAKADKFVEGVSLGLTYDLESAETNKDDLKSANLGFGATLYDQSLFSFLGIEEFGTLKTGVMYGLNINLNNNRTTKDYPIDTTTLTHNFAMGTKYTAKFSIFDVALHGGFGYAGVKNTKTVTKDKTTTNSDSVKPAFKYGVNIGTKEIIDNTNVYVSYEGEYDTAEATDKAKIKKSELTIGTKISF